MSTSSSVVSIEEYWARTVDVFLQHLSLEQQRRVQLVMTQPGFMRKTIEERERLMMAAAGES